MYRFKSFPFQPFNQGYKRVISWARKMSSNQEKSLSFTQKSTILSTSLFGTAALLVTLQTNVNADGDLEVKMIDNRSDNVKNHDEFCPCSKPEKHPCTRAGEFVPGCHELKVFSGNANRELAEDICGQLGTGLGKAKVKMFNDGEVSIRLEESVRGKDCYLVQPTCAPVNQNLMELLLMVSTLRRASAKRVTAVIPYYGYRRNNQEAHSPHEQSQYLFSSAMDVAKMLTTVGVDRIVVVGLIDTKKQFLGWVDGHFFDGAVPVEVLDVSTAAVDFFAKETEMKNPVVIVSPRPKCLGPANSFKNMLKDACPNIPSIRVGAVLFGNRNGDEDNKGWSADGMDYSGKQGAVTELVGDVEGCDVIVLDECIYSGRTLVSIAKNLKERGANKVYGVSTHSMLTSEAWRRVQASPIEKLIVTNTVPLPENQTMEGSKLVQLSIAPIVAQVIRNEHYEGKLKRKYYDRAVATIAKPSKE
jgi:ribose-phosphate pyrophosphokinase